MIDPQKIIIDADDEALGMNDSAKKDVARFLFFKLSAEYYCAPIAQIKEVTAVPEMTRVPLMPEFIVGVINLRGEIISVLDIRSFFGLSEIEKTTDARLIVCDVAGSLAGIIIDKIEGTVTIEKEAIQPPLATLKEELRRYTTGQAPIGQVIATILDLEKIFYSEAVDVLRKSPG